jgi:hypothetical protein
MDASGTKTGSFALRVLERNREQKLADYKIKHNATPIDGLPGVNTK